MFEGTGMTFDLSEEPSEAWKSRFERLGLGVTFGIVTACNPLGTTLPAPENLRRSGDLHEAMRRLAGSVVRLQGCSPDHVHCEQSFAAVLPESTIADLARSFRQEAYFWWNGAAFFLVAANDERSRVRLPFRDVINGLEG